MYHIFNKIYILGAIITVEDYPHKEKILQFLNGSNYNAIERYYFAICNTKC